MQPTRDIQLEDFTEHDDRAPVRHLSQTVIKAGIIAPRDIIRPISDPLIHYLHVELDRPRVRLLRLPDPRLLQLEESLVERLFPLSDPRGFVSSLRIHCQVTASVARVVAEEVGLPPDMTYVCGWLHDMGIASCLRHADEVFPIADETAFERLESTFSRSEAAHAIRLSSRWCLPSGIRFAIRDHVNYESQPRPDVTATATVLSERIVSELGFLPHRTPSKRPRTMRQARERLGIGAQRFKNLLRQVETRLGKRKMIGSP
jgi:hypothetical protein